jgi:hypothetical protein
VALTERDHELLAYCAKHKAAPLSVLAMRFFAIHPKTGQPNKDPLHACRRRIAELATEGYLRPTINRGPHSLAIVTPRAADALGVTRPGSLPSNGRVHHIVTLEIIEELRQRYAAQGVTLKDVRLEFQLRAEEQAGKQTRRGEGFESFPDAVIVLERRSDDGTLYEDEVALEYVTSKYSDRDILEKRESFARFDNVIWVSDRASTATRVSLLTGRPSSVHGAV